MYKYYNYIYTVLQFNYTFTKYYIIIYKQNFFSFFCTCTCMSILSCSVSHLFKDSLCVCIHVHVHLTFHSLLLCAVHVLTYCTYFINKLSFNNGSLLCFLSSYLFLLCSCFVTLCHCLLFLDTFSTVIFQSKHFSSLLEFSSVYNCILFTNMFVFE